MPELPEVEVVKRGLGPLLIGKKVQQIICANRKLRLPIPRAALESLVCGQVVAGVERRAKYLLVNLANGALLVVHLGMTGRLGLFKQGSPRAKHDHIRFLLDDGMEMRFNDTRRFGSVQVFATESREREEFFAAMGPEPFSEEFSASYLLDKARGRKQPVKNFLMDNRVVVGIGNIYASEILFECRISPLRSALSLKKGDWQRVVQNSCQVLERAILAGGSTISDYVNASGESGYFQLSLKVYGRQGLECVECGGEVEKAVMAGRAAFFCPKCQT